GLASVLVASAGTHKGRSRKGKTLFTAAPGHAEEAGHCGPLAEMDSAAHGHLIVVVVRRSAMRITAFAGAFWTVLATARAVLAGGANGPGDARDAARDTFQDAS